MAWLNLRKKKTEPEAPRHLAVKASAAPVPARTNAAPGAIRDAAVLRRPHISERASDAAAKGVYVFRVSPNATKPQIRAAVSATYKVTVEKVRTVTAHPKRIIVKGRPGVSGGGKKAYVYLKKGEKIDNL
jgi:large subunit ribosomal protein L23